MTREGTYVVPGCRKPEGGTFHILGLGPMEYKSGRPVGQTSYFIKDMGRCPTGDEMRSIQEKHPSAYVCYSEYEYPA